MHAVLRRTLDSALREFNTKSLELELIIASFVAILVESKGEEPSPEQIELRLIQSKSDIEHPPSLSSLYDN